MKKKNYRPLQKHSKNNPFRIRKNYIVISIEFLPLTRAIVIGQ